MEDTTCEKIPANSASEAIQSALIKRQGLTVTHCALRDHSGNGMNFDVPKHKALTIEDVERLKPKREIRPKFQKSPADQPAPWIKEWMDKRSRA